MVRLILDALVLYSAAWVMGVYGMMVKRPHEVGAERVLLHRRALRKAHPEAAHLLVPGADCVRIVLSRPARVVRMYPSRVERSAQDIFVSSDRPRELCALLGG